MKATFFWHSGMNHHFPPRFTRLRFDVIARRCRESRWQKTHAG
jgi:hypothetical protein